MISDMPSVYPRTRILLTRFGVFRRGLRYTCLPGLIIFVGIAAHAAASTSALTPAPVSPPASSAHVLTTQTPTMGPTGTPTSQGNTGPPDEGGAGGGGSTPTPELGSGWKPFGTERDFAFILIAVAIYALSVQLFAFSSSIQGWIFQKDTNAPSAMSGVLACILSTSAIVVLCLIRGMHGAPTEYFLVVLANAPRDFATGLLVASLVPSGIAASKVLGVYSSLRSMPAEERKPEGIGFAIGTALLGMINLAGSLATLIIFFGMKW